MIHSPEAVPYIVECPRLLSFIQQNFIFSTPSTELDEKEKNWYAENIQWKGKRKRKMNKEREKDKARKSV